MKEKAHIFYFDYLRILAAFFVIFMHVASGPLARGINAGWHGLNILTSLAFISVPLFFMMSGYLILSSEKTENVSVLFRHRLPRLVLPLIFWSIVSVVFRLYLDDNLSLITVWKNLIPTLASPAWIHLWYMYTLIALYVLSPFLRAAICNLSRGGHILMLSIIAAISLRSMLTALLPASCDRFLQIDIINKLEFFGGHLATFILGYYLGNAKKKFSNILLVTVAAVTLAAIILGTYFISSANGTYLQDFQRQSAGFEVILAATIFLLFKQNTKREAPSRVLSEICALSLPVYLMHNLILFYINKMGYGAVSFVDTLKISILLFGACIVVSKTLATVPFLSFASTGISFRDANRSCNWVYTFRRLFKKG